MHARRPTGCNPAAHPNHSRPAPTVQDQNATYPTDGDRRHRFGGPPTIGVGFAANGRCGCQNVRAEGGRSVKGLYVLVVGGVSLVAAFGGAAVSAGVQAEKSPVVIGGATVTNAVAVDNTAVRTYDAAGGNRSGSAGRVGCYFVPASARLACGPTGDGTGRPVWDVYRLTLVRQGAGTAITAVIPDTPNAQRALPSGTGLLDPHGWSGTVGPLDQAEVSSVHAATLHDADVGIDVGALGMIAAGGMALALPRSRRRRLARQRAELAAAEQSRSRMASFESARQWAWAPPVVPPSPTLLDPPPAPPRAGGPVQAPVAAPVVSVPAVVSAPPAVAGTGAANGDGTGKAGNAGDDSVGEPPGHVWAGPAVLILGPVVTVGWAKEPERRMLVELAAYLVTHQERRVTVADLRDALWPEDSARPEREVKAETVGQYMSRLRRCLGAEHLPDAGGKVGWQLASTVSSDWFRFQAQLEAARHADPERALELRREALGLVRGRPFAGVADGTFGWVWDEMLVSEIESTVVAAAHATAEAYLASGRPRLAEWAARRGLMAVPTDEQLLADRMAAAAADGGPGRLERAWRDAKATLGDQATDGPLSGVYDSLRSGAD